MNSIDIHQNNKLSKPCPSCSSENVKILQWVWWGGVIGAKLLKQAKCQQCGVKFNYQTGQKTNPAFIIILNLVMLLVFGLLSFALFFYLKTLAPNY